MISLDSISERLFSKLINDKNNSSQSESILLSVLKHLKQQTTTALIINTTILRGHYSYRFWCERAVTDHKLLNGSVNETNIDSHQ